jgi:hypothetical protein
MTNIITSDYYDNRTYDMLFTQLKSEDIDYIHSINGTIKDFLPKRWRTIINSLPENYYMQYASQPTQQERNDWFQRYLDLPTKDISLNPEIL